MKQERRKEATTDRDQDQLRDPETRQVHETRLGDRYDSHESYADSLRGKSDGEILARFEF